MKPQEFINKTSSEIDPYLKPTFSLGVEEEYMIIDPNTRELKSHL